MYSELMSLATGVPKMTADEFLAGDDWPRGTQLIEGEVVLNQPALPHQLALGNVYSALREWVNAGSERGLACLPVDVGVSDSNVYAPDVWWVGEQRRPPVGQLRLGRVPDLVVEVRSPATWQFDVLVKLRRYEQAGVAELWLVDTFARTVLVHRRASPASPELDVAFELESADRLTSPLLEGFSLAVETVFAGC